MECKICWITVNNRIQGSEIGRTVDKTASNTIFLGQILCLVAELFWMQKIALTESTFGNVKMIYIFIDISFSHVRNRCLLTSETSDISLKLVKIADLWHQNNPIDNDKYCQFQNQMESMKKFANISEKFCKKYNNVHNFHQIE